MFDIGEVTSDGLNLRKAPTSRGMIVDQLAKGDRLEIMKFRVDGWLYVRFLERNEEGYVDSRHVRVIPSLPPDVEPTPAKSKRDWPRIIAFVIASFIVLGSCSIAMLP